MLRYLSPLLFLLLLSTPASAATCGDMDGNGTITVTDGVNVLRTAAGLLAGVDCEGGPVPTPTPVHQPTAHATPIQTSPLAFLLGTWNFHFTIISSFTDTYRFQQLTTIPSSGKPAIVGLNQYGDGIFTARVQDLDPGSTLPYTYALLDNQSRIVCDFHLFGRLNDNSVQGDTFIMLTDSNGDCDTDTLTNNPHAMSGQKVSANANQIGAESLGFSLDAAIAGRAQALVAEAAALGDAAPAGGDLEPVRAAVRALMGTLP